MLLGVGLASLIGLYVRFAPVTEEPPPAEEPRIARVEIPAPPPPPEPTPMPEVVKETIKEESPPEKQQAAAGRQTAPAAPKVTKAPEAKKRQGLNNEAQVADVNKIGLLGALNRQPDKGSGVKVEHLIDQSIIKQTVTAQESAQVMIRTPPTGTLGVGAGGDPRSKTAVKDLSAASTALSGVKAMKTDSTGIMAGPGGKQNFSLGSGSGDSEAGSGAGGKGIGTMDGGEFSISGGGLDRDTVRRVIHSYKSQIRTCYERALLANPSFEGRVSYKWTITPTGVVVSAHIHKESVQSTNLKNCVLEVIQLMKFPVAGNGKPTVVIYPFVFQGKR